MFHKLKAKPDTVHWGYFDNSLPAVLRATSGDIIEVETITHQAGDAPDLLMDEEIRDIYQTIPLKDRAPGVHIMTGPIYVEEAEPGDTLEVRYLDLRPRLLFGSNAAAPWGYLHTELGSKARVTIFEIDAQLGFAQALYAFDYPGAYDKPGQIVSDDIRKESSLQGIRIPLNAHIGTAGVALNTPGRISTIPPGEHGGNIDNWRIGQGSSMFYPVLVPGALFSLGDPHLAQGDSELDGTAIEASLHATIEIILHKHMTLPAPLLELRDAWYLHGFGDTLDEAMKDAALAMLDYLTQYRNLSRNDAYALLSVAGHFGITQVVDRRIGVHVSLAKSLFP
ncbi:MAG: acetamidase/formamidase family protein [Firmicutes bacterium]|jgi:formamidase|uniref:Formamidase n=1 Tax=Sulfobacillus benefaciens TaxID=453960 RepID=A0A2T2X964_9FIRM|nr:acetamidase/formamidase family protein [Bacillota bacterium]PSR30986.1 MAG: formamidase [Sulfobacillus benefaciens]